MSVAEQIKIAKKIAEEVHAGQKRKFTDDPYISHPQRIAERIQESVGDAHVVAVAWLHDVIEDTDLTADDLRERGLVDAVVNSVVAITRLPRSEESYMEYLERVVVDYQAKIVKLMDLEDNMSNLKPGTMLDKYQLAHTFLMKG